VGTLGFRQVWVELDEKIGTILKLLILYGVYDSASVQTRVWSGVRGNLSSDEVNKLSGSILGMRAGEDKVSRRKEEREGEKI
jgi:hypothetical protein